MFHPVQTLWRSRLLRICLFAFCTLPLMADANEGKSEGGGKELSAHLEPFTVNLLSFDKYLQIGITLQVANTETTEKIKSNMAKVRHTLILLLSSKEAKELQSPEGKKQLIEEIREEINKALKLDEHEGVVTTYFESFVIQ